MTEAMRETNECVGCAGTGEIEYCTACNYHADGCKCEGPIIEDYANMVCPACGGTGEESPIDVDEEVSA